MGLDVAIDELYATGWDGSDESDCDRYDDGRCFPVVQRAVREASELGFDLEIRHIQLFNCYRAEWQDPAGASGAVVGQTESETAVYALSQLRRGTGTPAEPAGV